MHGQPDAAIVIENVYSLGFGSNPPQYLDPESAWQMYAIYRRLVLSIEEPWHLR